MEIDWHRTPASDQEQHWVDHAAKVCLEFLCSMEITRSRFTNENEVRILKAMVAPIILSAIDAKPCDEMVLFNKTNEAAKRGSEPEAQWGSGLNTLHSLAATGFVDLRSAAEKGGWSYRLSRGMSDEIAQATDGAQGDDSPDPFKVAGEGVETVPEQKASDGDDLEQSGRLDVHTCSNDPEVNGRYPGRPSVKRAIAQELERLAAANHLEETLAAQSRLLSKWAEARFPEQPTPAPKTVENQIRKEFRRLKQAHKTMYP